MSLACQRSAFEIPDAVSYLNAAYLGPLSKTVVAAGRAGLERKMQPWTITARDFFEPVEAVRHAFAQLIRADDDGVAIMPAVSYGVAIAAQNMNVANNSNIVILAEQFPSNVYSWFELADRTGAHVVTVRRPGDGDWTDATLAAIDESTAVCSIEPCHWTDGGLVDVVRVAQRVREVGAALVVDATQWVGGAPFPIEEVRPDFLLVALYKWVLAPYGTAAMWVSPAYREGRPIELSWITRKGSGDFAHLVDYQRELRPGARRFDVGQTASFAMIPAVGAALDQLLEWGVDNVCAYSKGLTTLIAERARERGMGVAPEHLRAPHMLGVHLSGADPEVVAAAMADASVHVSVRGDAMRVSPHVYNDERDVDRLFQALDAAI